MCPCHSTLSACHPSRCHRTTHRPSYPSQESTRILRGENRDTSGILQGYSMNLPGIFRPSSSVFTSPVFRHIFPGARTRTRVLYCTPEHPSPISLAPGVPQAFTHTICTSTVPRNTFVAGTNCRKALLGGSTWDRL